jgi:UDP-N-acetylmuramoyl-L-alanyl-D-glutamate--2,6-diaminopimelate ligase
VVAKDVERIVAVLAAAGVKTAALATDSRAVAPGDLFLAYPGERADGRAYIAEAVARGAAAVVWEHDGFAWPAGVALPNVAVTGLKRLAGPLAAAFHGDPSATLHVVAVTGTNGKTSCSQWIAQALDAAGRRAAVVGTLGMGFAGALEPNPNTTPDPVVLQSALRRWKEAGAQAVAMEASSIGLDQGRLEGTHVACALFTNLSRDHLDYHGDMERYAQAKMALFRMQGLRDAIVNLDDALGVRIAHMLEGEGVARTGYSLSAGAAAASGLEHWLEARDLALSAGGIAFMLESSYGAAPVRSPLLGRFNASNLLGVAGVLLASGFALADAAAALERLVPPAGRMQRIGGGARPLVVVDYAHSPDALDKALVALRDVVRAHGTGARLVCAFGCGGDRDRGKRPQMGEIASRHADYVVVTSDNPRSESPEAILAEIVRGVSVPHEVHVDRREGIRAAVAAARPGDVVLIAGKGHETYQEIAGARHPFSDAAEAAAALDAMEGRW